MFRADAKETRDGPRHNIGNSATRFSESEDALSELASILLILRHVRSGRPQLLQEGTDGLSNNVLVNNLWS
jgi:hypothetical protein